jgi:hypothetical protein
LVILTILLYIMGSLLALILLLLLFVLIVPFRYTVQAGYENSPWFKLNLRCSPAFIMRGTWNDKEQTAPISQIRLIIFGLPFKINPQKKDKAREVEKEKKEAKRKGFQSILSILDKDLRVRGLKLIKELLQILKPDLFSIKGRIGFEEPHLTGWLAAATNTLKYGCDNAFVEIEPYWEDEYYELDAIVKGRIRIGMILVKVGWFFLINRIRQFSRRSEKSGLTSPT